MVFFTDVFPEFRKTLVLLLAEQLAKVAGIVKAERIGYFLSRDIRKAGIPLGLQHDAVQDIVFCRGSGFYGDHLVQVVGCNMQFTCVIGYLMPLMVMVFQQVPELLDDLRLGICSGFNLYAALM